jgi:hypothetical protein
MAKMRRPDSAKLNQALSPDPETDFPEYPSQTTQIQTSLI